jgi:hypothetical protein
MAQNYYKLMRYDNKFNSLFASRALTPTTPTQLDVLIFRGHGQQF